MASTNISSYNSSSSAIHHNYTDIHNLSNMTFKRFHQAIHKNSFTFSIQNLTPNEYEKLKQFIAQANGLNKIHIIYTKELEDNESYLGNSSKV